MTVDIQPNQWYKVGDLLDPNASKYHGVKTLFFQGKPPERVKPERDVFLTPEALQKLMENIEAKYGDQLSAIMAERERIEQEIKNIPPSLDDLFSARFNGSKLGLDFANATISRLNPKVDVYGRVVHYPLGRPGNSAYEDIRELKWAAGYKRLTFDIVNPRLEDATNEQFLYESFDEVHVTARPYNFRMLLKSKNDVWVSDPPLKLNIITVYKAVEVGGELIVDPEPSPYNEVSFGLWTPENGGEVGPAYVPENKDKISQLEIMLQEKQLQK